MEPITRRNTETVEAAIKDMYAKIYEQQKRIDALQTALSSATEKINSLERQLMLMRAKSIGSGPSVK